MKFRLSWNVYYNIFEVFHRYFKIFYLLFIYYFFVCFGLWNPDSPVLESIIQLEQSGIPPTIGLRNLSSSDKESGIHSVESRIQEFNKSIQSTSKLFFLSACRVSYCVADPNFTKVFAFISRVQGKHDLNCYAFLCSKESMVSRKWAQSYRSPPRSGALARGGCIRRLYEWLAEIKRERGYSCQISLLWNSQIREHQQYLWNVIVLRGNS